MHRLPSIRMQEDMRKAATQDVERERCPQGALVLCVSFILLTTSNALGTILLMYMIHHNWQEAG
jgi:hypothetical protein